MGRIVAEYAQGVKEVGDLRRQNPLEPQAAKQIGLRFIARFIKTRLRGDELGQQFGELAKLDKARIWVVGFWPMPFAYPGHVTCKLDPLSVADDAEEVAGLRNEPLPIVPNEPATRRRRRVDLQKEWNQPTVGLRPRRFSRPLP